MPRIHRFTATLSILLAFSAIGVPSIAADPVRQRPVHVPLDRVTVDDAFWSPKLTTWRTVTVDDCLDKFEKDGAFRNFDHIARGELDAPHGGPPWYDGLVYEMIRGAADLMVQQRDPALEARLDGYIDRIAAAAARDAGGYINTYTQMREPNHRWGQNGGNDREQHDVYNIGCLVEAGIHYFRATGKTKLLATAVRAANGMVALMGPPPRKNIIPGHALSEESFVRLSLLFREHPELGKSLGAPVDEKGYLELARFWIDARGRHEGRDSFGEYGQDHAPVLQQGTIEGHAVRATLLAAGVAAYGVAAEQPQYVDAAERLWRNMVTRRLYITGGVGAIAHDEKFGGDFVLPNDGYLETCAAVACGFLDDDLFVATGSSAKVDELERSLYNGALAGVSLKGDTYFYENPLTAGRDRARWSWHPCPCCPPMFLKLMGALPGLIYATDADGAYVNLFIGSRARMKLAGERGTSFSLTQTTKLPWEGRARLTVDPERPATFEVRVRVPAWCRGGVMNGGLYNTTPEERDPISIAINGQPVTAPTITRGYAVLRREWRAGDVIDVQLAMPPRRVRADERVASDRGRVALMRGPIVYCLESLDNHGRVRDVFLPEDKPITAEWRPDLLGGVTTLRAVAGRLPLGSMGAVDTGIVAIPYYANANRGPAEMTVWLPASPDGATRPTIASLATPTASHCFANDTVNAMNDGVAPKSSSDETRRRFTWWDRRGTEEWAQYDFDEPRVVESVSVYWWDDLRLGRHCAPPAHWRLLFRKPDGAWEPVRARGEFGTKLDVPNTVTFDPVKTTALRIEAKLRPNLSAGILQWQVTPVEAKVGNPAERTKYLIFWSEPEKAGELAERVGMKGDGQSRILGFGLPTPTFEIEERLPSVIRAAFAAARKHDMAVMLHFDLHLAWKKRPDLWNWFDPNKPGFNPDNKYNVEWHGWDGPPNKVHYLNHGVLERLPPNMCYTSKKARAEVARIVSKVIGPVLREEIAKLNADGKGALFAGILVGSEPSIDDYSKNDPERAAMIKRDGEPATPLGYRALLDRGYSAKNPPADFRQALAKIVQETVAFWCEQFVDAGLPRDKLYPHVAAPAPIEVMNAPIWTAFNAYSRPGWTTYAVEVLERSFQPIYDELAKHGNPPWGGVEANAGIPGSVVDWETYLGWHYNHGCVLVGINMGATGEALPRRLWDSAFGKEAIAAYHKFLRGQPLREKAIAADHPQLRIQAKMKRVVEGIARWHKSGKDPSAVGKLMERVGPMAEAGKLVELEKLVDQALEMLGESQKSPEVYRDH
jgi:DUF1680 family protein